MLSILVAWLRDGEEDERPVCNVPQCALAITSRSHALRGNACRDPLRRFRKPAQVQKDLLKATRNAERPGGAFPRRAWERESICATLSID